MQGFLFQTSLIFGLGVQNIFVLHSGLRRQRPLLVAFVLSICDTFLIFVGVLGVATFFVQFPIMKIGLGFVGVGFLLFYGILELREANSGLGITQTSFKTTSIGQTILTSLGFSPFSERFYFGAGASAF